MAHKNSPKTRAKSNSLTEKVIARRKAILDKVPKLLEEQKAVKLSNSGVAKLPEKAEPEKPEPEKAEPEKVERESGEDVSSDPDSVEPETDSGSGEDSGEPVSNDDEGQKFYWNQKYKGYRKEIQQLHTFTALYEEKLKRRIAVYTHGYSIMQDFKITAQTYGKIIIAERYQKKKTIPTAKIGGVAGGEKYKVAGILFKFAVDDRGLYGTEDHPNDDAAAKVAGHELKSITNIYNQVPDDLTLPLMVTIDYLGFRLVATAMLPIDPSTLQFGCRNISEDNPTIFCGRKPELDAVMSKLGEGLKLREHTVFNEYGVVYKMRTPVDMEGHVGHDGTLYAIDYSRLFPPEAPSPDDPEESYLYKLLRPEFVLDSKVPLCSDAFSNFMRDEKEKQECENDIREATRRLHKEVIPKFALAWSTQPTTEMQNLVENLHRWGINVRHLGAVMCRLPTGKNYNDDWKKLMLVEMLCRVIKLQLRAQFRKVMKEIKSGTAIIPYKDAAVGLFNVVFGDSDGALKYWEDLFAQLKQTFKASWNTVTCDGVPLAGNVRNLVRPRFTVMFSRLCDMTGVKFSPLVLDGVREGYLFSVSEPFDDLDVMLIEPLTKSTPHGPRNEGMMLLTKGLLYQTQPGALQEKVRQRFALSLSRFQAALVSDPNSQENLNGAASAMNSLIGCTTDNQESLIEKCRFYYSQLLEKYPNNATMSCQYCQFLLSLNEPDLDLIESHWLLALEQDPKIYYAYYTYSQFLASNRQEPEWAARFLDAGKKLLPDPEKEQATQDIIAKVKSSLGHKLHSFVRNLTHV